jgi:hypothetical protein
MSASFLVAFPKQAAEHTLDCAKLSQQCYHLKRGPGYRCGVGRTGDLIQIAANGRNMSSQLGIASTHAVDR